MKLGKHVYDTDDSENVHLYGLDISAREIWLTPRDEISFSWGDAIPSDPGVEYSMANQFLKNLHILMNSGEEPILIHMKSYGGDWDQGIAIYDAIKTCPCHVTIINYTMARSMSSLIFCAADKRVMMPHSWFMFHDGTQSYDGTVKQFLTEAEMAKTTRQQMKDIYVGVMQESRTWRNKSTEACKAWLVDQMDRKEEVYLTPKEAIKNGFADEIFNGDWDALVKHD